MTKDEVKELVRVFVESMMDVEIHSTKESDLESFETILEYLRHISDDIDRAKNSIETLKTEFESLDDARKFVIE